MGKITKKLKADDVGDMGIGAMIVFIAMVLVAGIAASVLIQTANRLEIQAMTTGQETTGEVSTGVHIMDIEGMKVGDGIQYITLTLVPRAGSRDIDLSQTYVEISDSTVKCVLMYLSDEFHNKSEINGSLFTADFFDELNSTRFGVIVLEDADHSISSSAPVINRGDKVMLTIDTVQCFGNVNGIDPRDDIFGIVQSEAGAPGVFSFRAPSSIAGTNIVFDLY